MKSLPGAKFTKENPERMADTTEKPKKAKAPAKPRATAAANKGTAKATTAKKAASKEATETSVVPRIPSHEEIASLARRYWAERGHTDGHAEQDWLRAERELMKQAS